MLRIAHPDAGSNDHIHGDEHFALERTAKEEREIEKLEGLLTELLIEDALDGHFNWTDFLDCQGDIGNSAVDAFVKVRRFTFDSTDFRDEMEKCITTFCRMWAEDAVEQLHNSESVWASYAKTLYKAIDSQAERQRLVGKS